MGKLVLAELDEEYLMDRVGLSNDMDLDDFDLDAYREPFWAYLPDYLEELAPLDEQTLAACEKAAGAVRVACEQLMGLAQPADGALRLLREEAVASARIEGIDASMESLVERERLRQAGVMSRDDSATQAALDIADVLRRYATGSQGGLSLEVLCDMNEQVAKTSEVAERCGCLREAQVWIGEVGESISDAAYVPPPVEYLEDYLRDLVRFVNHHLASDANPLALAAISHAQLALIHPFEDGNGRTARVLSQIVLCKSGLTNGVVLSLSRTLLAQRTSYIDMLTTLQEAHDTKADPNRLVRFFCQVAEETAAWVRDSASKAT